MAHKQKTAFIPFQELLENIHRKNIKVVCRLVEYQKVWILEQESHKKKPLAFTAAQTAYRAMLNFSFKAELFEELCGTYFFLAIVESHVLGTFFNVFQDGEACIFEYRVLRVVAELCVFTHDYSAAIRSQLACDYVEEGRFAASVIAKDSDFLSLCKDVGKIGNNRDISGGVTGASPVRRGSGRTGG